MFRLNTLQKGIKKDTESFNTQVQGLKKDEALFGVTPTGNAIARPALSSGSGNLFSTSNLTSFIGGTGIPGSSGAGGITPSAGASKGFDITSAPQGTGGEILTAAPELVEAGIKVLGGKEATIQGGGDQAFKEVTSSLWKGALKTGNPYAIAGAGILKGVDFLNRYAGKKTQKQGTDAGLKTGGYALQLSQGAGQKTTLTKRKWAKDIDRQTKRADRQNLLAGRAAYAGAQNELAASNTYGDIVSKTQQQLGGSFKTNILSAKQGTKINPKKLSNIKKKALYKVKKAQEGINPDDLQKMQDGGQFNVIPEGALHARKNNYDGELGEQVTSKGIPVITYNEEGKIVQHAEIEHSEIIFSKEVSTKLEDYFKQYKETDDKLKKAELELECGRFLAYEILENTEDNMGLIEQV